MMLMATRFVLTMLAIWLTGAVATQGGIEERLTSAKSVACEFAVVASGISESLVATAAGIVVGVIAVMAYNAFQIRWSQVVLTLRISVEELTEILSSALEEESRGGNGA